MNVETVQEEALLWRRLKREHYYGEGSRGSPIVEMVQEGALLCRWFKREPYHWRETESLAE